MNSEGVEFTEAVVGDSYKPAWWGVKSSRSVKVIHLLIPSVSALTSALRSSFLIRHGAAAPYFLFLF
jgi:hypothetical protein